MASGTIPLAQLPAGVITNGASGVSISGSFTGNGGGLTNLSAQNIAGYGTWSRITLSRSTARRRRQRP